MPSTISSNLQRVFDRIAEAARRAGRSADEVSLVAVTKQRSVEEIRQLIEAGQRVFAENRVHESLEKIVHFDCAEIDPPIEWHFIGHLQTNKVKKIVCSFALFHGVDSLHLAEALQNAAENADCTVNILLEVNVSGEASKYGLTPENAEKVARELRYLDRICCQGLMTMAPWEVEAEATRPVFRNLRELMERLKEKNYDYLDLRHLSMGMTNDFEVAVEEGATLVRVGTALFQEG
jgi:pyridoxal phosphate enzyme (YggS family)